MDYIPFIAREPTLLDKVWATVSYPINLVNHPMDALMSIPALSFLIIPAFSSYGTTANFFFFYLTWAILIRSNDPLKVELLGTLGIRLFFYILPSLAFLFFDSASPNLAVAIKEHGHTALPMGDEQGGRKGRWWKITLISIINVLIGVALQTTTELLFTRVLHTRSALKISTTPPFPWSIAKDLLLGLVLREILTYVLHRYALHSPKSPLTKMHTSWQHSIVSPFSFVAHYDHPLAYIIHVFLPTYIPAVFFRMHLLTYHLYLIIVSLEETFAYSGYNVLPTAFILGGIARRQERHLMGNGKGNYGCFGLVDFLMGTSLGADLLHDVRDEAEDKQVAKKAKGKARKIGKKAQKAIEDKTPDEGEDEVDDSEEPAEADPPKRNRRSKASKKKSAKDTDENKSETHEEEPEEEEEEEEKEVEPKPKPKANSRGRKGKKSSDEAEEHKPEDDRPKRKPSNAGKNGKKTPGRAQRKKSEQEDE